MSSANNNRHNDNGNNLNSEINPENEKTATNVGGQGIFMQSTIAAASQASSGPGPSSHRERADFHGQPSTSRPSPSIAQANKRYSNVYAAAKMGGNPESSSRKRAISPIFLDSESGVPLKRQRLNESQPSSSPPTNDTVAPGATLRTTPFTTNSNSILASAESQKAGLPPIQTQHNSLDMESSPPNPRNSSVNATRSQAPLPPTQSEQDSDQDASVLGKRKAPLVSNRTGLGVDGERGPPPAHKRQRLHSFENDDMATPPLQQIPTTPTNAYVSHISPLLAMSNISAQCSSLLRHLPANVADISDDLRTVLQACSRIQNKLGDSGRVHFMTEIERVGSDGELELMPKLNVPFSPTVSTTGSIYRRPAQLLCLALNSFPPPSTPQTRNTLPKPTLERPTATNTLRASNQCHAAERFPQVGNDYDTDTAQVSSSPVLLPISPSVSVPLEHLSSPAIRCSTVPVQTETPASPVPHPMPAQSVPLSNSSTIPAPAPAPAPVRVPILPATHSIPIPGSPSLQQEDEDLAEWFFTKAEIIPQPEVISIDENNWEQVDNIPEIQLTKVYGRFLKELRQRVRWRGRNLQSLQKFRYEAFSKSLRGITPDWFPKRFILPPPNISVQTNRFLPNKHGIDGNTAKAIMSGFLQRSDWFSRQLRGIIDACMP